MGWPGPMTHRQMLVESHWLSEQMNVPDKSDWYQMQTACEVRRVLAKRPASIKPEQFKLKFVNRVEPPKEPVVREEADPAVGLPDRGKQATERSSEAPSSDHQARRIATARSQMAWIRAVGGKVRVMNADDPRLQQ